MPDIFPRFQPNLGFLHIFMKVPVTHFNGNLSSDSPDNTCGETDGWTDKTKELGAFRDYANAPKNLQQNKRLGLVHQAVQKEGRRITELLAGK